MLGSWTRTTLIRQIGLNTTWLGLARLVTQLQLAALTLLAARRLGSAVYGEYALITSIVVIGNVLTTFGTDTLLIREVARDRPDQREKASAALVLQLGLSAFLIALIFIAGHGLPGLDLYALTLIPLSFFSVYTAVLRGYERMDLFLLTNLIVASLQAAGAWVILTLTPGLVPLLAWLTIVQAGGAAGGGWMCRAAGFPGFNLAGFRIPEVSRIVRAVWPLAAISLLGIIYLRMGVLVLSALVGGAPVGWFSAASRLVDASKLAHIAVLGALLPALARSMSSLGRPAAHTLLRQAMGSLAALSLAGAVFLTAAARPLINLLLGPGYAPAAPVLQVLSWSLIPYTISACLSVWEVVAGRERRLLAVIAVSTGLSLAVYLALVTTAGLAGAAWAALTSECLQAGIFLFMVTRR
jgi:O-antigen/teichoic acid export membrane protein